jgi:hypothetical protein
MLERRSDAPASLQAPLPFEGVLGAAGAGVARVTTPLRRRIISKREIAEICASMQSLVEEDLARGRFLHRRRYCDACECVVCAAGFMQYERYALCTQCATEYAVATARGIALSVGRFVRDKNFGETGDYALDPVLSD